MDSGLTTQSTRYMKIPFISLSFVLLIIIGNLCATLLACENVVISVTIFKVIQLKFDNTPQQEKLLKPQQASCCRTTCPHLLISASKLLQH